MFSFLDGLRFRTLVILGLALLAINMVIPDPIPFIDEILIAVVTLLLSRFKKRPREAAYSRADAPRGRTIEHEPGLPRKP